MHEMSIVMSIIEIAEDEATKAEADIINSLELDIGELSGIELEALDFAWQVSKEGTMLENARLKINRIEGKSKCSNCSHVFKSKSHFDSCPLCNEIITEIIQGKEMKVKAITVN